MTVPADTASKIALLNGNCPYVPDLPVAAGEDLWVFGYGSLMWDPGFPFTDRQPALLHGYHRRFCVYSHRYRGTPKVPGLVFGLDRGGSCRGLAFRVAAADVPDTLVYLWDREMVSGVYKPSLRRVRLPEAAVPACCFVVDRTHRQYCGGLALDEAAEVICRAQGLRGPNCDYLFNTIRHLQDLGIADRRLEALAERVGGLLGLHGALPAAAPPVF